MTNRFRRMLTAAGLGLALSVAAAVPAYAADAVTEAHTTGNPARSVVMFVKNTTGCSFKMKQFNVYWGMSFNYPYELGSSAMNQENFEWISTESNGYFTGTQGDVTFEIDACGYQVKWPNTVGTWKFAWNNPYVGSNSYSSAGTTSHLKVSFTGGSGNNAVLSLTISAV